MTKVYRKWLMIWGSNAADFFTNEETWNFLNISKNIFRGRNPLCLRCHRYDMK